MSQSNMAERKLLLLKPSLEAHKNNYEVILSFKKDTADVLLEHSAKTLMMMQLSSCKLLKLFTKKSSIRSIISKVHSMMNNMMISHSP